MHLVDQNSVSMGLDKGDLGIPDLPKLLSSSGSIGMPMKEIVYGEKWLVLGMGLHGTLYLPIH